MRGRLIVFCEVYFLPLAPNNFGAEGLNPCWRSEPGSLREQLVEATQDAALLRRKALAEPGTGKEPLALPGRHVAHAAKGAHHLLALIETQASVLREDFPHLLALLRRKAAHNLLPLAEHLLLLRTEVIPTAEVLADLRLTRRREVVKPRIILKDPILLTGRQIAQIAEEIGRMTMRVALDALPPPLSTFLRSLLRLYGHSDAANAPG